MMVLNKVPTSQTCLTFQGDSLSKENLIRDACGRILALYRQIAAGDQSYTGSAFCVEHAEGLLAVMIDSIRVRNTLSTHDKSIIGDLLEDVA